MVSRPSGVSLLNLLKCVLYGHVMRFRLQTSSYYGYAQVYECERCKQARLKYVNTVIAPGWYTINGVRQHA